MLLLLLLLGSGIEPLTGGLPCPWSWRMAQAEKPSLWCRMCCE